VLGRFWDTSGSTGDLAGHERRAGQTGGEHGLSDGEVLRPARAVRAGPLLLPAPAEAYDVPVYATAKVPRDHHIEVAKALYSVPGNRQTCRGAC
jgi:hypothetical protein